MMEDKKIATIELFGFAKPREIRAKIQTRIKQRAMEQKVLIMFHKKTDTVYVRDADDLEHHLIRIMAPSETLCDEIEGMISRMEIESCLIQKIVSL